jgi:serine/threonine-protein kinase RsbT
MQPVQQMQHKQQIVISICNDLDIVQARAVARDAAREIGFGPIDQARIATAISELARNVFLYAGKGSISVQILTRDNSRGIEFYVVDTGPGIADVELALQDGYTTSKGMGMGLPGAKRLMDEFVIESYPGRGTTIMCRKWRHYFSSS